MRLRDEIRLTSVFWQCVFGTPSIDKVLDPVFLIKQIEANIGWFGLERQ